MSWSFSVKPTSHEAFASAIEDALAEAQRLNPQVFVASEVMDQVVQAVAAAVAIVQSEAVGTKLVGATLSGHANPDHTPRPGYSHDTISISVYCAEGYA